eukprot:XP_001701897.1 predicted protein [Chlamydomonas reinhardtii]
MQQGLSKLSRARGYDLERLPEDSPVLDFCNYYDTSDARESFLIDQDKRRRRRKRRMSSSSSEAGSDDLRIQLAAAETRAVDAETRAVDADTRAEDEQRLRLDAERRASAAERLLDVAAAQYSARMAALLDMLVTAAVVALAAFFGGFGALAPLYIVFVSWRCRDLLPRPHRQWRGVVAAAATVAFAAFGYKVATSAGFVSKAVACASIFEAVAYAAFVPCVALLVARAALVTLTRAIRS